MIIVPVIKIDEKQVKGSSNQLNQAGGNFNRESELTFQVKIKS
jgi:hypothetical protein